MKHLFAILLFLAAPNVFSAETANTSALKTFDCAAKGTVKAENMPGEIFRRRDIDTAIQVKAVDAATASTSLFTTVVYQGYEYVLPKKLDTSDLVVSCTEH